jgi:hypothetical protein
MLEKMILWSCAALISLGCATARCETLLGLSDLSSDQQAELYTQIDAWGAATAEFDYCRIPLHLIADLTPIFEGCVDPASLAAVLDRFTAGVVAYSGAVPCDAPGVRDYVPDIQRKAMALISAAKIGCAARSFYKVSLPKINLP